MEPPNRVSYLEYYLEFFRNRPDNVFIDLYPEHLEAGLHACLDDKFGKPLPPSVEPSDAFDRYIHPCWCCPELIYVDALRGNEVWLHRRIQ